MKDLAYCFKRKLFFKVIDITVRLLDNNLIPKYLNLLRWIHDSQKHLIKHKVFKQIRRGLLNNKPNLIKISVCRFFKDNISEKNLCILYYIV